ncbi:MAG: 4-hydroxy-tetrahydrodipicolinate reductase [Deltaproteobacteria bacterium]
MSAQLVISGATGRMGRTLLGLAARSKEVEAVGALEATGHAQIGQDAGVAAGTGPCGIQISDDASATLQAGRVLIEFSWPEPSLEHARIAAAQGCGVVLGTTGFSPEQQAELDQLATRIPLLQASNMSVGVTLLTEVVESVARKLGTAFDIEVVETHHRLKKDAPSGTALTLAGAAASGRDAKLADLGVYGREGMIGERKDEEIGVMALRGGDVVGDHTVFFFGTGERLEFTHRAQSREAFASGALRAAAWLAGRAPGHYSMRDVLVGAAS